MKKITLKLLTLTFIVISATPAYSVEILTEEREDGELKFCISHLNESKCYSAPLSFEPENTFVYSNKSNEILIHGSCCGRDKSTQKDYYRFIAEINEWVLFKSIAYDSIGPFLDFESNAISFDDTVIQYDLMKGNKTLKNNTLPKNHIVIQDEKNNIIRNFNSLYQASLNHYKNKETISLDLGIIDIYEFTLINPINKNNVSQYNDLGFFLQFEGRDFTAIYTFQKVLQNFPNRAVTYLNIADSYWTLQHTEQAKEAYQHYIDLMKAAKKEAKIPKRVFDRVSNS